MLERLSENFLILDGLYFDSMHDFHRGFRGFKSTVFADEGWNYLFSEQPVVELNELDFGSLTSVYGDLHPPFVFLPDQKISSAGKPVLSAGDFSVWMSCQECAAPKPSHDVTFKTFASPTDSQVEMLTQVFRESYSNNLADQIGYNDLGEYYSQGFARMSSDQSDRVTTYCAFLDESPVGVASIVKTSKSNTCGLYNVGIVPKARKKGIGALLSRYATSQALQNGAPTCILQTESHTKVQELYEDVGYVVDFHLQYTSLPGNTE